MITVDEMVKVLSCLAVLVGALLVMAVFISHRSGYALGYQQGVAEERARAARRPSSVRTFTRIDATCGEMPDVAELEQRLRLVPPAAR